MIPGHLILALLFIFCIEAGEAQDSHRSAEELSWNTERLERGIYWKHYRGNELFDSRQNINLIEVFLDSAATTFKVAFHRDSILNTSRFAEKNNALAAINGSYFREDTGSPLAFLKIDGEVVVPGQPDRNLYLENGGIGWSENEPLKILKKPQEGWKSSKFQTILSSGPLLIFDSKIQVFNNDSFHQNRHPRTAIAITNDRRVYLVTIDGRSFQSYGMTIPELSNFLVDLGAEHALNLDGGGSTTMWIRNKTENGIVNYPSDNLEFDHKGEISVANALIIVPSN
ncbi:MAG: phosphodiester glycosidase family protein [Balneolaceae bacterium]|nr:phosphodiester glycosidase family protein [Balneolaceae bacterium]